MTLFSPELGTTPQGGEECRYLLRVLAVEASTSGSDAWGVVRCEHPAGTPHPDLVGVGLARLTPGTTVEISPGQLGSYRGRPQVRLDRGSWKVVGEAAPEQLIVRGCLSGVRDYGPDLAVGYVMFTAPVIGPDGKMLPAGATRRFRCDHALGIPGSGDCRITGRWTHDERYGRLFDLKFHSPDGAAIVRMLVDAAAGRRIGWGKAACKKLVDRYGLNTLNVLVGEQSEDIANELGVATEKVKTLIDAIQRRHMDVELKLIEAGFGPITRRKILELFEPESEADRAKRGKWAEPRLLLTRHSFTSNPYVIQGQVPRLQFANVDRLAVLLGLPADSPARLQAWTEHLVREECDNSGDTEINMFKIFKKVVAQLCLDAIPPPETFLSDKLVAIDDTKLALRNIRTAEEFIVDRFPPPPCPPH